MVPNGMALGDKSKHRASHPQVQQIQIIDRRDRQHPHAIRRISQPMDDEGSKKESHRHIGGGNKPVGENIPCDMSQTQLHVESPIKVCSDKLYSKGRPP